jgi:anti-sigma factor RsiW
MNINRHNYEAFFLLYVDKELSATDRKAVEVFVQENPDLQMELALLQQTVVNADDIVLYKKDWLYMEEDISAQQENLLLYADGELGITDKNAVESLLNTNARARAELDILQQSKLQPDMAVVFEDKALLYRREAGKVVGFKWWRVAAAAVLLGFGLWAGVSVYKNNTDNIDGSEVVVNNNEVKQMQAKTKTVADANQVKSTAENTVDENSQAVTREQTGTLTNKKNATSTEVINSADNQNSNALNQTAAQQNNNSRKPDNNLPKSYLENINNNPSNETIAGNVQSENNNNQRVSGNNEAVVKINPRENKAIAADINSNKTDANITAMQVVNTNTADNGEDNSRYLNVDDSKGKRSALGGFIRKAKRVLERTANVKTGEGIKIAGFEIALK